MANAIRPTVGLKTSDPAVYQIAGPRFADNSRRGSDLSYPVFFLGAVVVAILIFFIRKRDLAASSAPGLVLGVTPASDTNLVENLTQEIEGMVSGSYNPQASAI